MGRRPPEHNQPNIKSDTPPTRLLVWRGGGRLIVCVCAWVRGRVVCPGGLGFQLLVRCLGRVVGSAPAGAQATKHHEKNPTNPKNKADCQTPPLTHPPTHRRIAHAVPFPGRFPESSQAGRVPLRCAPGSVTAYESIPIARPPPRRVAHTLPGSSSGDSPGKPIVYSKPGPVSWKIPGKLTGWSGAPSMRARKRDGLRERQTGVCARAARPEAVP